MVEEIAAHSTQRPYGADTLTHTHPVCRAHFFYFWQKTMKNETHPDLMGSIDPQLDFQGNAFRKGS